MRPAPASDRAGAPRRRAARPSPSTGMAMMPFVSMRYTTALASSPQCASRGVRVMMCSTGKASTSVSCSMSRVRSPAVSTPCSRRSSPTTMTMPRCSARTTTACTQRRARRKDRQRIGDHHLVDPREAAAGRARRQDGGARSPRAGIPLLEQRHGQRVAQRERGRRAGGRREVVRTRLLAHPRVERDVAVPRQRRARLPRDGDGPYAEALEMLEQRRAARPTRRSSR